METTKDESIVDAAITHLKNHPLSWFSIDELCASISISKRTFYTYFETKNKLVEKIIQKLISKWKSECMQTAAQANTTKASFLAVYTYHLNEVISFNSDFLNGLKLKFPGEYAAMDEYFAEVRAKLLKILEEGRAKKEIKEGYNLQIFIEKEISFFEYLQKKHYVFTAKEDYIKLLNLSLDGLLI
ncbi:MAG TPA: TetR/AcrR family transcriptional regulator [Cytophagaceae bacterium]|nr:TetR/AcrR family transcriptional regulator [Cytophagaceae bacterium]